MICLILRVFCPPAVRRRDGPAASYLCIFSPCSDRFACEFKPRYVFGMRAKPQSTGRIVDQLAARCAALTCDAKWRIGSSVAKSATQIAGFNGPSI